MAVKGAKGRGFRSGGPRIDGFGIIISEIHGLTYPIAGPDDLLDQLERIGDIYVHGVPVDEIAGSIDYPIVKGDQLIGALNRAAMRLVLENHESYGPSEPAPPAPTWSAPASLRDAPGRLGAEALVKAVEDRLKREHEEREIEMRADFERILAQMESEYRSYIEEIQAQFDEERRMWQKELERREGEFQETINAAAARLVKAKAHDLEGKIETAVREREAAMRLQMEAELEEQKRQLVDILLEKNQEILLEIETEVGKRVSELDSALREEYDARIERLMRELKGG